MEVANSGKRIQHFGRIKLPLPGVAEFSLGDDVRIPLAKETHARVTIGTLRSLVLDDDAGVLDDPVLHRLVLNTGLLLHSKVQHHSVSALITFLNHSFSGHQGLVEQGILHRDMSPGNIFIGGPGCAEGWEGFVADLEFASSHLHPLPPPRASLNTRGIFLEETVLSSSKVPGAEITGTALFMAEELLSLMLLPDNRKIRPAPN
ncbi:hypothetical protein EDB19DRAFT_2044596 [Suillus lakei]|nr:hypothetical protein EDB19DRAFT_2044596 [Suillus lakei]